MLNRHVLVLNQNFEPLSVCSVKRAIIMVYLNRAEVIESLDGYKIHSVSLNLPVPSVVRLGVYVKVPVKRIMLTRKNIIKRDGYRCQYCGKKVSQMTVDHVIPKNLGGRDIWENLVAACPECNNRKGQRTPEQAGLSLIRKPRRPNHITFIQQFIGVNDIRWKQYLFMD
ncbi:MAG: HNH endonuclease [candidate division Zixibacteria bacterium 4484_95]|nr:MAG: HNH endonuclease [candidate division Zixibacteria bacterium 4484_95]RKX21008.1 MAG: HNH endonuclease [candidate division Zixibacteria bacterium]